MILYFCVMHKTQIFSILINNLLVYLRSGTCSLWSLQSLLLSFQRLPWTLFLSFKKYSTTHLLLLLLPTPHQLKPLLTTCRWLVGLSWLDRVIRTARDRAMVAEASIRLPLITAGDGKTLLTPGLDLLTALKRIQELNVSLNDLVVVVEQPHDGWIVYGWPRRCYFEREFALLNLPLYLSDDFVLPLHQCH